MAATTTKSIPQYFVGVEGFGPWGRVVPNAVCRPSLADYSEARQKLSPEAEKLQSKGGVGVVVAGG